MKGDSAGLMSPRSGWRGWVDRFVGPGATPAELWLQFAPALLVGLSVPIWAVLAQVGWSIPQMIVAGLLALDVVGGAVTNATLPAKRWYHRTGTRHEGFVLSHGAQIFLVCWLFRQLDWVYFAFHYGALLAASAVIVRTPERLRRPTAFLLFSIILMASTTAFLPSDGMAWFVPLFFLKVLISHLLPNGNAKETKDSRP